jgi:hypothetical protein
MLPRLRPTSSLILDRTYKLPPHADNDADAS